MIIKIEKQIISVILRWMPVLYFIVRPITASLLNLSALLLLNKNARISLIDTGLTAKT
jgi:hypothetical protein